MRKAILLLASIPFPAAAPLAAQSLPGVSDEETEIPSGGLTAFERGNGDVVFVRHRTLRWYRVGLNDGCLTDNYVGRHAAFVPSGVSGRIDRLARVVFPETRRTCRVVSIRRSAAPPQYDSDSVVTPN